MSPAVRQDGAITRVEAEALQPICVAKLKPITMQLLPPMKRSLFRRTDRSAPSSPPEPQRRNLQSEEVECPPEVAP